MILVFKYTTNDGITIGDIVIKINKNKLYTTGSNIIWSIDLVSFVLFFN